MKMRMTLCLLIVLSILSNRRPIMRSAKDSSARSERT